MDSNHIFVCLKLSVGEREREEVDSCSLRVIQSTSL